MSKISYILAIFFFTPAIFPMSQTKNLDQGVAVAVLTLKGPLYQWDQNTFQKWRESLALLQKQSGTFFPVDRLKPTTNPKRKTNKWTQQLELNAKKFELEGKEHEAQHTRKVIESLKHLLSYFDAQNTHQNSNVSYYVAPELSSFPLMRVQYGQRKKLKLTGKEGKSHYDIYTFGDLASALEFGFAPEAYLKKHPEGTKKFKVDLRGTIEKTRRFAKKQELPLKDLSQDDSTTPLLKSSRRSSGDSSSEKELPDFFDAFSDGGAAGAGQSSPRSSSYGSTSPMSTGSSASTSPSPKGKEKIGGYVPPARI